MTLVKCSKPTFLQDWHLAASYFLAPDWKPKTSCVSYFWCHTWNPSHTEPAYPTCAQSLVPSHAKWCHKEAVWIPATHPTLLFHQKIVTDIRWNPNIQLMKIVHPELLQDFKWLLLENVIHTCKNTGMDDTQVKKSPCTEVWKIIGDGIHLSNMCQIYPTWSGNADTSCLFLLNGVTK